MMYWTGHMSTGGWILSVLWTLTIVALVVAGIVWLVSTLGSRGTAPRTSGPSARETLDRRLASGELTIEQYEKLRAAIGDPPSVAREPRPPTAVSASG
jgi:putative membrane protein